MILSHDRSGYFGASDVSYILGNRGTASFKKWWLTKIGIVQNNFENIAMNAGTHWEHRILESLGIPIETDKQIIIEDLLLRVNLDGNTDTAIYEVKTHNLENPFKVSKKYREQVQVQMYATGYREAYIASYGLSEQDYKNYFNQIDKKSLLLHKIEYDEEFINQVFLPNIKELAQMLNAGVMPT